MKYREVAERLVIPGCVEVARRSGGSHRKGMNPATGTGTVVPDWGAKELKLGTVRAVVRQPGLEWQAFHDAAR